MPGIRHYSSLAAAIALSLGGLLVAPSSHGQAYPNKPLRFIPMGTGSPENAARIVAAEIAEISKQSVIVDPKPGANGILASEYVAKQPADGYTILVGSNSTHAANQAMYKKLPYDHLKDFQPISGLSQGILLAAVNPQKVPVKTIAELTALARKEPGKLSYGWGGSAPRAAAELYNLSAGIKIDGVPYKSNPQVVVDLVGGRLDLFIGDLSVLMPQIKSGALRPLAVSSTTRFASLPEVPTMQEAGVPDYDLTFWLAAYVPAGTPRDAVQRLNEYFVAALKRPKVLEYLTNVGSTPFPTSPDELMKFQTAETAKWKKIVSAAGIQPE